MPDNSSQAPYLWKGFLPKEYRQLSDSLSSKMKMNADRLILPKTVKMQNRNLTLSRKALQAML